MADLKKFEEMLERLINEDKEGAEELFHEIVVEKSREIYENLLSEEEDDEVEEASQEDEDEVEESSDEEVDEASDDEDLDEDFNLDEFEVDAGDEGDMGGDATDDMLGDLEGGDDEEGEEGDEDLEDRVVDLEDALDELKAEFEKLMSGEEGEEEHGDMDMGDMGGDEEGEEKPEEAFQFEDSEEEVEESRKPQTAGEQMREYVEKITAKMGDNGQNTKSPVAGKNDMGGTTANIAKGGTGSEKGTGAKAPKEDSAGNVNVPGGKASKSLSSVSKPKMGDTGTNGTKSTIGQ